MKSSLKLLAAMLATALFVSACGGDDDPAVVAATDTTAAFSPTTAAGLVAAVADEPFVFTSGVEDLGTSGVSTTVTLKTGATPSFIIEAGGLTAEGDFEGGSCKFKLRISKFKAPHRLAIVGDPDKDTVIVPVCKLVAKTSGFVANDEEVQRAIELVMGSNISLRRNMTVKISSTGVVTVRGQVIGTIQVRPLTGTGT